MSSMPRRTAAFAASLLLGLAPGACGDDPYSLPDFDPSLGVDVSAMTQTDSGLYYRDLVVGSGQTAVQGGSAEVAYSGWLADGTLFDSGSFTFTVGVGQVIDGFDEGVAGMKVGGKRRLVIPPDLAYGSRGSGSIPGNATLVFEVELLSFD
jgi:peptidylprolyl isomerase